LKSADESNVLLSENPADVVCDFETVNGDVCPNFPVDPNALDAFNLGEAISDSLGFNACDGDILADCVRRFVGFHFCVDVNAIVAVIEFVVVKWEVPGSSKHTWKGTLTL
jgi:hypothetical protein